VQWYGDKKAGHLSNENKNHEGYRAEIIRVITKLDYLGIWMKVNRLLPFKLTRIYLI
jgi:hypothetical protein